jgi:hypothetical protein
MFHGREALCTDSHALIHALKGHTGSMLPVYVLDPCRTCGHANQGTRAKAGNSVPCTNCGTMRRVPVSRPLAGPDDPSALKTPRGRSFERGNKWRFRPDDRVATRKPVAVPTYTPTAPQTRVPRARGHIGVKTPARVSDYVTDYSPHITASESPLPFRLPPVYIRCTVCAQENRKNSRGIFNQAGMHFRAWNKQSSVMVGEANVCESCYLDVLKLWSQHKSELRFRFSADLQPGI